MSIAQLNCTWSQVPSASHVLSGVDLFFRYGPRRRLPGWSVRNPGSTYWHINRPVYFEYVCPYCGNQMEGKMHEGWKHCICSNCGQESDFTVTINSPHGYFYGGGINDGKELLDAGYFAWLRSLTE